MRTVRTRKGPERENTNARVGSHGPQSCWRFSAKRKKVHAKTERGTFKTATGEVPGGGSLRRAIRFAWVEVNFGLGVGVTRSTDHLIGKLILGYRFDF